MNRHLGVAAFAVGLGAVGWVAYGYLGSNRLALTITLLIGAFYLMGAVELHRFRKATDNLRAALAVLPDTLPALGDWLATLHPSLRNAVRLRIEGERTGLPGPSMTPYLVGLLVLLGMLGTFLGMVVTLNGAVIALESTTDLATIRAALAAPIKGLGLAFGTSIAGVAASAMLGLVSALYRRERLGSAQSLDARIATTLRRFSRAHQREKTLETLQLQARVMPEVVDRLQTMMAQMERHSESLNERLLAGQEHFYQHAQSAYADLASSVDKSLKDSLMESARLAGMTIQPVVEATMAGITRETAAFQQTMSATVQQQLDGLSSRFDSTVTAVSDTWTGALAGHDDRSQKLTDCLQQSLAGFNDSFEQRAAALLASVDERHMAAHHAMTASVAEMAQQTGAVHAQMADTSQRQLDGVAERFGATTAAAAQSWRDALAEQQRGSENLSGAMQAAVTALVDSFGQQSVSLLETVAQAHARLQTDLAGSDQQRLTAWSDSLETMASSLRHESRLAGAQSLERQEQICTTLEQTARTVQTQAAGQASATIAEMAKLIETASEAPRAAAQVIGELREKLSDSMVRDNDMLEERSRIMGTLSTLLDAVNQAATEQRTAIDALVASTAAMLERAGAQFGEKIAQASEKMETVAAQATGSTVDIASMGEAFGVAVQQFGASSDALTDHLQRIEAALNKSSTRSDEQLAYYVAQAREIVDLSISSQKQIVDDLQQLAIRQQVPLASEVA
jgi:hypothetical protein